MYLAINSIQVSPSGDIDRTPEILDDEQLADDGTLNVVQRARKRKWQFETDWIKKDPDGDSLEASINGSAFCSITGDIVDGATVSCRVRYRPIDSKFGYMGIWGIWVRYRIEMRER